MPKVKKIKSKTKGEAEITGNKHSPHHRAGVGAGSPPSISGSCTSISGFSNSPRNVWNITPPTDQYQRPPLAIRIIWQRISLISTIRLNMKRIMLSILSVLLAVLLILVGIVWAWSPGKIKPFLDETGKLLPGSISEKIFVDINGIKQGMFIRSKDAHKPVLLYLHGGMPDVFLTQQYPTRLEDDFTVVWWEQRGAGLSFQADMPPETITPTQLVADIIAVTNYLRNRFGQDKIYLMGHSGGTFIGIQAAAKAPELYHAYIGVAQVSNQLKSEVRAYKYMLERFQSEGNKKMVQKLKAAPVTMATGIPTAYLRLRDPAMHRLGIGTTHDMHSVITGIFITSWQFQGYTIREKINLWRAKFNSGVSVVWNTMVSADLSKETPILDIPVYFFHGIYDYTCSYTEAKAYFEQLQAPVKGFYTFEKSAHSPLFEEPEKMQQIMREDVLAGKNKLSDKINN